MLSAEIDVQRLHSGTFQDYLQTLLDIESLAFQYPYDANYFCDHITNRESSILIATSSTTTVGFIVVVEKKEYAKIPTIAVHPDYRRRRIGTQLLQIALERIESGKGSSGKPKETLTKFAISNHSAEKFFVKKDFKIIRRLERPYLRSKEDAYVAQRYI